MAIREHRPAIGNCAARIGPFRVRRAAALRHL